MSTLSCKILYFTEQQPPATLDLADRSYTVVQLSDSDKLEIAKYLDRVSNLSYPYKNAGLGLQCHLSADSLFQKSTDTQNTNYFLQASYFVGVSRLTQDVVAVVKPKQNYDYLRILDMSLKYISDDEFKYCAESYGIDFNSEQIELDESVKDLLSPLLIVQYIAILDKITKRGLRKGYVYHEENLQSKIKGSIKISKNIHENLIKQRYDKTVCCFSEFTEDIPENRLLKKALEFSLKLLNNLPKNEELYEYISHKSKFLINCFSNVSSDIKVSEMKTLKFNKIFVLYKDAITLAKLILRRCDYSIEKATSIHSTYPYWIDMSKMYELYVLGFLRKVYGDSIKFQVSGYHGTRVDFIRKGSDEESSWIIDAKYKPRYDGSNKYMLNDIEEISRYARDEIILSELYGCVRNDVDNKPTPYCIIIHPQSSTFEKIEDRAFASEKQAPILTIKGMIDKQILTKIKGFSKFYKMRVELPVSSNIL